MNPIRVTIWNEFVHEQTNPAVAKIYPRGIHGALAAMLESQPGIEVRTATPTALVAEAHLGAPAVRRAESGLHISHPSAWNKRMDAW